ncbi:glycosyltransferase family 2 protein [bacterium]|nr:glycosyltransferase family 2 protein [bacterium]
MTECAVMQPQVETLGIEHRAEIGDVPVVSVVFPAYNEKMRLPATLEKTIAYLESEYDAWEIIVADDGSADGTPEMVEKDFPQCRVIRAPHNMGKGAAVRRGMLAANGRFRLFSDADLSTPIEELGPMVGLIQSQECDIVIGSRALSQSHLVVRQPWWRELSGRLFNMIVQPISGLPFHDTQCGFKLFRDQAAEEIFARQRSNGWAFDVEILMLAQFLGFNVLEHPVTWLNSAASKVSLWRDAPRMIRDIIIFRWRRLTGSMLDEQ